MKIRSYKGARLEALYEAIRRELGPDAVVISTRSPDRKNPFLGALTGGGGEYELIAVADDSSAERHLREEMGGGVLVELSERQEKKLETLESTLESVRGDLRGLSRKIESPFPPASPGLPDFAADWDPRFAAKCGLRGAADEAAPDPARVRERVKSLVRVGNVFAAPARRGEPEVVVFVGPTGSGKTTTLAKLAARLSLDGGKKAGLITTDTFRVAAVDQIKEYATLLGLELGVAFSAAEAARVAASFSGKDYILVDTPGRNHYDKVGLAGIRALLQGMGKVTVLLHIPAVMDRRHITELISNFQVLNPNALVITKTDEIRSCPMLTSLVCETDRPIAFFTDGQRVPQDIHAASPDMAANLLMPAGNDAGGNRAGKPPVRNINEGLRRKRSDPC